MKKNAYVHGYIGLCSSQLIQLLLECIQRVNIEDEDEEDEELGVALSSGCCLAAVALVIGNNITEPVIAFVSNFQVQIGNLDILLFLLSELLLKDQTV